ncbi:MAG: hypothetical protein AABY22_00620, partial [Nanoarchaeota archaeon]
IKITKEKDFYQINSGILSRNKESIRAVQPLSWFIDRFGKGLKIPLFCWLIPKSKRQRALHKDELNRRERLRMKNDSEYRAHRIIKDALDHFLKDNFLNKNFIKTLDILGYTDNQLVQRLKSTLVPNMTWQDFMYGRLHVEHIICKRAFKIKDIHDPLIKLCWSLKNMRLLWGKDNLSKGDLLPDGRRARDLKESPSYEELERLISQADADLQEELLARRAY